MLPGRLGLALPPTRRDDGVANVGKGVIGVFPIWEPPYQSPLGSITSKEEIMG